MWRKSRELISVVSCSVRSLWSCRPQLQGLMYHLNWFRFAKSVSFAQLVSFCQLHSPLVPAEAGTQGHKRVYARLQHAMHSHVSKSGSPLPQGRAERVAWNDK